MWFIFVLAVWLLHALYWAAALCLINAFSNLRCEKYLRAEYWSKLNWIQKSKNENNRSPEAKVCTRLKCLQVHDTHTQQQQMQRETPDPVTMQWMNQRSPSWMELSVHINAGSRYAAHMAGATDSNNTSGTGIRRVNNMDHLCIWNDQRAILVRIGGRA